MAFYLLFNTPNFESLKENMVTCITRPKFSLKIGVNSISKFRRVRDSQIQVNLLLVFRKMSLKATNGNKKRKQETDEDIRSLRKDDFAEEVGLEMQSEDEGEEGPEESDEGEADEFPELDTGDDTDEDEVGAVDEDEEDSDSEEEEEEEEDEEEEGSDEGETSDGSLHVFPRAKVITSKITGQPKKVYPEIEPDYDSDSSTEDVSCLTALITLRIKR